MPTKKIAAKTKTKTPIKVAAKKKVVKKVAKKTVAKKTVSRSKAMPALRATVHAEKIQHQKEPNYKRVTYMFLSVLLGLFLGTFVTLFMELVYMHEAGNANIALKVNYFLGMGSYLPAFAQPTFLLCGLVFGVWLGFWGWDLVYVQRRHRMYKK